MRKAGGRIVWERKESGRQSVGEKGRVAGRVAGRAWERNGGTGRPKRKKGRGRQSVGEKEGDRQSVGDKGRWQEECGKERKVVGRVWEIKEGGRKSVGKKGRW